MQSSSSRAVVSILRSSFPGGGKKKKNPATVASTLSLSVINNRHAVIAMETGPCRAHAHARAEEVPARLLFLFVTCVSRSDRRSDLRGKCTTSRFFSRTGTHFHPNNRYLAIHFRGELWETRHTEVTNLHRVAGNNRRIAVYHLPLVMDHPAFALTSAERPFPFSVRAQRGAALSEPMESEIFSVLCK